MLGTHYGDVRVTVKAGHSVIHELVLRNVIYCEDIQSNLLSLPVLFDLGYEFSMSQGHSTAIRQRGQLVADTVREGFLFRLATPTPDARIMIAEAKEGEADVGDVGDVKEEDLIVSHRKMAHLNGADVKKLERMAVGVKIKKGTEIGVCGDCLAGKQHRTPSREPSLRSSVVGDLIHMDSSGKIDPRRSAVSTITASSSMTPLA